MNYKDLQNIAFLSQEILTESATKEHNALDRWPYTSPYLQESTEVSEERKDLPVSRMSKQARHKAFRLGNEINDPESGIGLNVKDDPTAKQLRNMARVGGKQVKSHIKKGYEQGRLYDPQNVELNWKRNNEEYDLYDVILSHLIDEGYAETPEQAQVIMVNMSEDWRESICEGYKPLRTSDEHYDDEGFPTTTRSWDKKMTNARLSVGKQKMRSRENIGDPIGNLTKGVSAKNRLNAMKKVDDEPESVRAKRSQAKAAANRQLGTNRRSLQTSLDREHLTKSLNK